tara:strand:- start:297 stop:1826 length:1530 start_codon:yes stop_codon:yes gene_type:complete
MKILYSNQLTELSSEQQQCAYNGMDALMTYEIHDAIKSQANVAYSYVMSFIPSILQMMTRGIKIDDAYKKLVIEGDPQAYDEKLRLGLKYRAFKLGGMVRKQLKRGGKWVVEDHNALIQDLAHVVWQKPLNYHSEKQLKAFFYDELRIPKIWQSKKGKSTVTCGRDALEKIEKTYPRGAIFASIILRIRDLEKQVETLTQDLSEDGRWIASYNPSGTDTWRWSSSNNPLGHSANIQNINPELRRAFVADPGYTFFNADQQGAEARGVAYLSGDTNYIRAVESGDVHTMVASMVWGFEARRELSDREFIRGFSYRDMCKKLAHGTAYGGMARTLAQQASIELGLVEEFQRLFFRNFPLIKKWQEYTIRQLQVNGKLDTPFGFVRKFWGRLDDESTWRAAIAFRPQHIVGLMTAIGIRNLHASYEPHVQVLANGHDAVLGQIKNESVDYYMPLVLDCLSCPLEVKDIKGISRIMTIPWDAKIGHNWGDQELKDGQVVSNFDGLHKWKRLTS